MGRTAEIKRLRLLQRHKFSKREHNWIQGEIDKLEELQEIERREKDRTKGRKRYAKG